MKKSIFATVLGAFLFILSSQTASATNPISQEVLIETGADVLLDDNIQKESLFKRFVKGVKKKIKTFKTKVKGTYYKIAGMFDDPVRKWMWFWLLFGLLAVILIVVAVIVGISTGSGLATALWYLGWGSSLFSSISFIIWIIKLIQG